MTAAYVHFLDIYHYTRARRSHGNAEVLREAQRALRLAVAWFDRVFVPASSFFESDLAKDILGLHPLLCQSGRINLIAAEPSLEEHREAKIVQYGTASPLGLDIAYGGRAMASARYVRRNTSARLAIEHAWSAELDRNRVLRGADPDEVLGLPLQLESAWSRIPAELGDQAFITDHAYDIASRMIGRRQPPLRQYMERVIERAYMDSYVLELAAGVVEDLVCLASPFDLPASSDSISYGVALRQAYVSGFVPVIDGSEAEFINAEGALHEALSTIDRNLAVVRRTPPVDEHSPTLVRRHRTQAWTPGIAILTALEYEFLALRHLLVNPERVVFKGDPNQYLIGWLPPLGGSGKDVQVLLTQCPRMNTKSAGASAARICLQFESVTDIVMAGIAGAVPRPNDPARDVRLGDVVVADRAGVIDIDHVTRRSGMTESRSNLPPPSARLVAVLNANEYLSPFQAAIQTRLRYLATADPRFERPPLSTDILRDYAGNVIRTGGRPEMRIFRGLVGSGDSLVRDPQYRDQLATQFGVLALEMESAGLAESAYQAARQYFVVRSLVDYCDTFKDDTWHWHASASVAAVVATIVSAVQGGYSE